ncbi:Elongator complex protein 4 [Morella rubra]|uniref:Elongator complex protein 4 n=1 Tax=Morella rubra TaxID=262757 RepID=A0A6A1VNK0_9ROSI|nr:Elongator complex protein 4 [Morella rubra]
MPVHRKTQKDFLGTLPSPGSSKYDKDKSRSREPQEEEGLRIAWQYKKYFGENHLNSTVIEEFGFLFVHPLREGGEEFIDSKLRTCFNVIGLI